MIPRFFCPMPIAAGSRAVLPDTVAHHAGRVLRLAIGDRVTLFNGEGGEFEARISALKPELTVTVGAHRAIEREAALAITLAQVVPAGEGMDWVVQKATELGVSRIAPLVASRSVLRLTGERAERRRAHWQQIAIGACEQCGRNRPPRVETLRPLPQFLAEHHGQDETRLVMMPEAGCNLAAVPAPGGDVLLLVGPEGGLTEDEWAAAQSCGYRALQLGPRVLRADTAGIAAIAALLARWGDF